LTCIQRINVFGQHLTFFNTGSYTVEMTIKRIKLLVYNKTTIAMSFLGAQPFRILSQPPLSWRHINCFFLEVKTKQQMSQTCHTLTLKFVQGGPKK